MSINLKVEEYCQNCPDFEPDVDRRTLYMEGFDPATYTNVNKTICETTVECKYKRRCAAQMRYLQKQNDAMQKKETGDGKDN